MPRTVNADLTDEMERWATEDKLRDRFDAILVPNSGRTSGHDLHLSDPDGPAPDPSTGHSTDAYPVCARKWARPDDWKTKFAACYPPGHKDWCRGCIKVYWLEILGRGEYADRGPHTKEAVLRRLYWGEGYSMTGIAEKLDVSEAVVRRFMDEHDIERRPASVYLRDSDPEDRIDPERAEVA